MLSDVFASEASVSELGEPGAKSDEPESFLGRPRFLLGAVNADPKRGAEFREGKLLLCTWARFSDGGWYIL